MFGYCCTTCAGVGPLAGVKLAIGGPDHTVTDARGRAWLFEMHPYSGPLVLRQDGKIAAVQPGYRSAFWPAFEAWQQQQESR